MPLLAIGVLIAGFLLGSTHDDTAMAGIIPNEWVASLVGGNSVFSNFFASIVGAFMYFATLTEVPILQGLIAAGMGKGPALALLLAGPSLSLPNMLQGWYMEVYFKKRREIMLSGIFKFLGIKKLTLVHVLNLRDQVRGYRHKKNTGLCSARSYHGNNLRTDLWRFVLNEKIDDAFLATVKTKVLDFFQTIEIEKSEQLSC